MAKAQTKVVETVTTAINPEMLKAYTNKAISIVYNGNKKYSVVSVDFDLNTGNSGNVSTIEDNLDIYEAQHVFKTATVKFGMFDEGVDN